MQVKVLLSALLLVALSALPSTLAQDQPKSASGPELAADFPLDRAGVLIQGDGWVAVANQNPTKTKVGRVWAASLSYGAVPAKIVAEYRGEHSSTQVENVQPVLCVCHFASIPGDPVLVRLHAKKGIRELDGGRMFVYPVVGNSKMADANKSDLIPADVSHPNPQVWLIRPQIQLDPGEYALMMGTQNMAIFPFTVATPSAHPGGAN
jgi:hypothetical protein